MEFERQFRIAIKEDNVDAALQLLNDPVELDANTVVDLLHLVVQGNHACVVERLVEMHPESINARSQCETVALHCAAQFGKTEIVKLLVRLGSQSLNDYVNPQFDTETVLHLAAKNGHTETVETLVQLGCTHLDTLGMSEKTPFYKAIEHGHLNTAKTILRLGSQALDISSSSGDTPLHVAASNGDEPAVQFILDSGSKAVKRRNAYSQVPIYAAARAGSISIVKILLERSNGHIANTVDGWTLLHSAVLSNHTPMIEFLLEHCYVDVNARTREDVTPFFTAATACREEALITLLRFDSNVHRCSRKITRFTADEDDNDSTTTQLTPLEFVCFTQRRPSIARFLLCLTPIDVSEFPNVPEKSMDRLLALQSDITEEERDNVRFPIYFAESLVIRLLRVNTILDNGKRRSLRLRRSTIAN